MAHFPPNLLKCVVFLGYKDQRENYHFAGSAFWISRAGPDDIKAEYRPAYLVTAAHVTDEIHNKSADSRVWMRINTKQAGQDWREMPFTSWTAHTDRSVDIAVAKIGIGDDYDHVAWPMEQCVTSDRLDTDGTGNRKVELGDEVCFAGLFYPHTGQRRNIPVVRIGTVAALRGEPVLNRDGLPMDAYLIESRSIGGLSGSPVFIDIITAKTVLPPTWGAMAAAYDYSSLSRFKLFGLVHGHFGDDLQQDTIADDGKDKIHINAGIAMVIPAEKIIEVLGRFEWQERIEAEDVREKRLSVVSHEQTTNTTYQISSFR